MALTVGSLFSGVGGFDLGLERAGFDIKWQVEIDPFCNRVLARHWPHVARFGDIRECGAWNLEPVDLVCGGPPCQPTSVAGQRKGTEDDRWLWGEAIRIIAVLRPKWIVLENPAGLLSLQDGLPFESINVDLESNGYTVQTFDLPAPCVGLYTLERHLWLVATTHCFRPQGRIIAQIQGQQEVSRELQRGDPRIPNRWAVPSARVCGVAEGISYRVDRIRALGNAVPPPVVEVLGHMIISIEEMRSGDH